MRMNVLGHMQQGGVPSPFDRNYGTKMAAKCVHWFKDIVEANIKNGGCYCSVECMCVCECVCVCGEGGEGFQFAIVVKDTGAYCPKTVFAAFKVSQPSRAIPVCLPKVSQL